MGDPRQVAEQFINHYCTTFRDNRAGLAGLYNASSTLSWEQDLKRPDDMHRGPAAITAKLQALPAGTLLAPSSIDVQPSLDPSAILVMVAGQMLIGGEQNPLSYCQLFIYLNQ